MVSELADEIYSKSIHFKKYNKTNLMFKKNRVLLEKEIRETEKLIDSLIFQLKDSPEYSSEYYEMALYMHKALEECLAFLTGKSKNYRGTVERYVWGFHNLPRAFLSIDNSMNVSLEQANEYFKSYLKMD